MPNFQIALSGVEPGTYGGLTLIPCIKVDNRGRITFADNIDLKDALAALQGESNTQGNVTGRFTGDIFTNSISTDGTDGITVNSELRVFSDVVTQGRFRGELIGDVYGDLTGTTYGTHVGSVQTDSVSVGHIEGRSFAPQIKIETEIDNVESHALLIKGAFVSQEAQSLTVIRSRGSLVNPLPLENEDLLFGFEFLGTSTEEKPIFSSGIRAIVDGEVKPGVVPGKIFMATANKDGQIKMGFSIDSDQVVEFQDNLVASDKVNTSSVSYLKVKINGSEFAIPVHPLNS